MLAGDLGAVAHAALTEGGPGLARYRVEVFRPVQPMLAQAASQPPDDADWAYEIKWDGMRALVRIDRFRVHVRSRRGVDFTAHFPELHTLASAAPVLPAAATGVPAGLTDRASS